MYAYQRFIVSCIPYAQVLWRLLHTVQGHHSDVAERLGLVFPSLLRAMFVLLAVVYAWAVVAYGLLWDTPVG
jgi:hypothetical protein